MISIFQSRRTRLVAAALPGQCLSSSKNSMADVPYLNSLRRRLHRPRTVGPICCVVAFPPALDSTPGADVFEAVVRFCNGVFTKDTDAGRPAEDLLVCFLEVMFSRPT